MKEFNKIYSENNAKVLNYLNFKIRNTSIAEELANDVFMRVYKHLDNYDSEKSTMSTWVMNITNNILIDHYRKKKLDTVAMEKEIDGKTISFVDNFVTPTNPHTRMVSAESVSQINCEIQSLPSKYREISNLFFNKEQSYNELSKELNLPIGTVKGQINRARKKLVKRLTKVNVNY